MLSSSNWISTDKPAPKPGLDSSVEGSLPVIFVLMALTVSCAFCPSAEAFITVLKTLAIPIVAPPVCDFAKYKVSASRSTFPLTTIEPPKAASVIPVPTETVIATATFPSLPAFETFEIVWVLPVSAWADSDPAELSCPVRVPLAAI